MDAGRELSGYETQYKATLEKNAEIDAACANLEKELNEITAQLPRYASSQLLLINNADQCAFGTGDYK